MSITSVTMRQVKTHPFDIKREPLLPDYLHFECTVQTDSASSSKSHHAMSSPLINCQPAFEPFAKTDFRLRHPTVPTASIFRSGVGQNRQKLLRNPMTMSNTPSLGNPTAVVLKPRRSTPYPSWPRSPHRRDREGGTRRRRQNQYRTRLEFSKKLSTYIIASTAIRSDLLPSTLF